MIELFLKGGPVMYIILFFSVLGTTVILERFYYLFFVERGDYDLLKEELKEYIEVSDIAGAKKHCLKHKNSVSKILYTILDNLGDDRILLEEKIREVALFQIPVLERYMWFLGLTAQITPLLGLLGTVTGMIKSFNIISMNGVGKPELLAVGISEALIATAAGLFIAIPCVVIFNFLNNRVETIINDMEKTSVEFLNLLGR